MKNALNEDIKTFDIWLKENKLSLNVGKTRSMIITSKQKKKYLEALDQTLKASICKENVSVYDNTLQQNFVYVKVM